MWSAPGLEGPSSTRPTSAPGEADTLREPDWRLRPRFRWYGGQLADLAEGTSVIVVGSHGRSMLNRIFLGSVSMSLLHHATAPVLLVRMNSVRPMRASPAVTVRGAIRAHPVPADFSRPPTRLWRG